MTPERVIINNPVYSETIEKGISLLEKYKAEDILGRVQDELWRCGEIVTVIDQESQTVSLSLQNKTITYTANEHGPITKEIIEWVEICPEGDLLTINSNRSPTSLVSLNPQDISQEELEEQIYKILEEDSNHRSFGKAMILKIAAMRPPESAHPRLQILREEDT